MIHFALPTEWKLIGHYPINYYQGAGAQIHFREQPLHCIYREHHIPLQSIAVHTAITEDSIAYSESSTLHITIPLPLLGITQPFQRDREQ
jgi:hypothetical protein